MATAFMTYAGFAQGLGQGEPTSPQIRWALVSAVCAGGLAYRKTLTGIETEKEKDQEQPAALQEDPRQQRSNRHLMLERVRIAWIKGVLERSVETVGWIDLGLQPRPDAVHHPAERVSHPPAEAGPSGTSISAVFDELGQALLILGAPGSGKTTQLLDLARALLKRAEDDDHPIPVVFNLSSWAVRRPPLADWLVGELAEAYDVPRRVGKRWVNAGYILPLLDGLDEVGEAHRDACVEAINAFRQEHGLVPLAVCSRTVEYAALTMRLRLLGAVEIQPLTRTQVSEHLEQAGEPLAGLRTALGEDPTLWELLDSPLMLSIMALALQGMSPAALQESEKPEQRRQQLFAAYVNAMFERRREDRRFPRSKTVHWLAWLARSMQRHHQAEFFLERLQRDWLPTRAQQRTVTVGSGLLAGLVAGLFYALLFVLARTDAGLVAGLVAGVIGGLIGGLFYALGERSRAPLADHLRWSWAAARAGLGPTLVFGLAAGLIVGLDAGAVVGAVFAVLAGLLVGLVNGLDATSSHEGRRRSAQTVLLSGLLAGLVVGLSAGLFHGLQAGLFAALLAGLICGLDTSRVDTFPAEPTRTSARNALRVGLLGALAFGLLGALLFGLLGALRFGLLGGLAFGQAAGLFIGLLTGLSAGLFYGLGERSRTIRLAERLRWSWRAVRAGLRSTLALGLIAGLVLGVVVLGELRAGLVAGLVTVLVAGLVTGLDTNQLTTPRTTPNEGLRRSARNAVLVGMVVAPLYWLAAGPAYGLAAGLVAALFFGGMACFQHLLLRSILVRSDAAPQQYARFLDDAAERLLLRKVGGGYIFAHRLLLEYFATLEPCHENSSASASADDSA